MLENSCGDEVVSCILTDAEMTGMRPVGFVSIILLIWMNIVPLVKHTSICLVNADTEDEDLQSTCSGY